MVLDKTFIEVYGCYVHQCILNLYDVRARLLDYIFDSMSAERSGNNVKFYQ
ncbi:MAG: hypothetical protein ACLR7D_13355 [Lachnospira eligens]